MFKRIKNRQYYKFCWYGFLKNLRLFDAFFILFLLEKGLSYSEIGILYAIREISINLFEIPSGVVADTYGRKNALVFSFVLYIFSFLIFYLSANFWFFSVAFILYGMADAFRSGTHKGMIMHYLKNRNWDNHKVTYYGHTRACSQRGSAIASLVAGGIVFYYGSYHYIFLFSIIPYLINLLLVLSYPKELNSLPIVTNRKRISYLETWKTLFYVLKQVRVLQIVNVAALFTAYQKSIKDYIQPLMLQVVLMIPLLNTYSIDKKKGLLIGVFYFIIYLLTAKASQFSGKIAKNNVRKTIYRTMLIGFSSGILSGVFYLNKLWVFSLLVFVNVYLIENIRKPILTGALVDEIPPKIVTSVLSVQSLLRTIFSVILVLLLGFFSQYFGIGMAFLLVSLLLLLITLFTNRTQINGS